MRTYRLALMVAVLAIVASALTLARPGHVLAVSQSTYSAFKTVGAGHTFPGGAWGFTDGCDVGLASGQEYRCAAEFDMSNIPSSAKIMSAVVALKKTAGCPANDCSVDLAIYAGNGNDDLGDVLAGSVAATFSPGTTTKQFNVIGQVQDQVSNGGDYFGIRLSRNASTTDAAVQSFGLTDFKLTVSYINRPVDVNVTLGGLGQGTVTSDPAGIDCGATCTWWFEWLEPVTLTAEPQNGGTFNRWEGGECDGSTNPVCSFDVPALPVDTTAVFDSIGPPISGPPNPTPTAQLTPPPLTPAPTSKGSAGPAPTGVAPTSAPPTDVIASDGTVITPAPTQAAVLAPGATPAPTIVGLDNGSGDAAATGSMPLPILIARILVLGGVVGGSVYWFTKRRQAGAP
ncbi:MAG TPA: hypothetical protein VJ850_14125 [Candidatus Limnocylindrales bacterium]|nr:hypothetical protein [Candidatus Limnocylindrales bacterium]